MEGNSSTASGKASSFKLTLFLVLGLLAIVLVAVATLGILMYRDSSLSVKDLIVTNVTDTAFTVTWVSDSPYIGRIYYQKADKGWSAVFAQSGKDVAYDDRDVELNEDAEYVQVEDGAQDRYTHHVTIRDLEPETEYSFRIGGSINGKEAEVNTGKTLALIEDIQTPDPAYGIVEGADGRDGFIVLSQKDSDDVKVSTVLSAQGTYSLDLNIFKVEDATGSIFKVKVRAGKDTNLDHNYSEDTYKPFERIVIENSEDETVGFQIGGELLQSVSAYSTQCPANLPSIVSATSGNVNIREAASTGSAVVGKISQGRTAHVSACVPGGDGYGWYSLDSGGYVRVDVVSATTVSNDISEPSASLVAECNGLAAPRTGIMRTRANLLETPQSACTTGETVYKYSEKDVCCRQEGSVSVISDEDYLNRCNSLESDYWDTNIYPYYTSSPTREAACSSASSGSHTSAALAPNEGKICCRAPKTAPVNVDTYEANCTAGVTNEWETGLVSYDGGLSNTANCEAGGFVNALTGPAAGQICCRKPKAPAAVDLGSYQASCNAQSSEFWQTNIVNFDSAVGNTQSCVVGGYEDAVLEPAGANICCRKTKVSVVDTAAYSSQCQALSNGNRPTIVKDFNPSLGRSGSCGDGFRSALAEVNVGGAQQICCRQDWVDVAAISAGAYIEQCNALASADRDVKVVSYSGGSRTAACGAGYSGALAEVGGSLCCKKDSEGVPTVDDSEIDDYIRQCNSQSSFGRETSVVEMVGGASRSATCSANGGTSVLWHITTADNKQYVCCKKTSSSSLNDNLLEMVSAQSLTPRGRVLQAADQDSLEASESGRYVFFQDGNKIGEEDIIVDGDSVQLRLYTDENDNGVKDAGEEYFDDYSSIRIAKEASAEEFNLNSGWNLINLPMVDTRSDDPIRTAGDLIDYWNDQGADIKHVARFVGSQFEMFSKRESGTEYSNDFDLIPGQAVFVYNLGGNISATFSGNKFEESVPLNLNQGWNLVGIIAPNQSYTSETLLEKMEEAGVTADTISQFENGLYQSVVKDDGTVFGNNYNIVDKRGYFVRVEEGGGERFTP